jgi:hypoxanthine phosphoribosyltransferase
MRERYRQLYDRTQVNQRIGQLASEITARYPGESELERPLFVGLLRGAMPFASKLMFEIERQAPDFHPELDVMMVSTYGSGRHAGEPRIVTDLAQTTSVFGRPVVILDDVLDQGITADFVTKHLDKLNPGSIELAVLAKKAVSRVYDIEPDYYGFDVGAKWIVGMGMDDARAGDEHYRWLDEIWEVAQDDDPPMKAELSNAH